MRVGNPFNTREKERETVITRLELRIEIGLRQTNAIKIDSGRLNSEMRYQASGDDSNEKRARI